MSDEQQTDALRRMAFRRWASDGNLERQLFVSFVRFGAAYEFNSALREGRDVTPVYWYVLDDGEVTMTLWEIE